MGDLAVNYVERHILLAGHTSEITRHDYGIDLIVSTYTEEGELESDYLYIQVKGTDCINVLADGTTISFVVDVGHVRGWMEYLMPVYFVLYDARNDCAYWLHVQDYFSAVHIPDGQESVALRLRKNNLLNVESVRHFAYTKGEIIASLRKGGVVR